MTTRNNRKGDGFYHTNGTGRILLSVLFANRMIGYNLSADIPFFIGFQ